MLKYVLLILTTGLLFHAKHVDVYANSAAQTVAFSLIKRQILRIPGEVNNPIKLDNVLGNKRKSENAVVTNAEEKEQNATANTSDVSKVSEHKETNSSFVGAALAENKIITAVNGSTGPNITNQDVSTGGKAPVPPGRGREEHEHNGALLRSFYVFLGLSAVVMIYLSFRAFRVRSGAPPPSTVRKYGVVGRRSDMEMLPLPLNEEDDDDTLFDVGNQQPR